jgi:hypothetical protein
VLDLLARDRAVHQQRDKGQAGGQDRHHDRDLALDRAAHHQLRPERHALAPFQVLDVADQHDAVAGHDAKHGEEADERAERDHPAS